MGKILGGKAPEGLLFSRKDVIRMILPAIAEQALAMLVGMADSLMLAGVGERAVSAVSLVDQINILMINLFAALATGGAVIAGQCLGAKDDKRACHITDQLALVQILLWCDSLAYKRHPIRENRMGKVRMALKMLGSVEMLNNN